MVHGGGERPNRNTRTRGPRRCTTIRKDARHANRAFETIYRGAVRSAGRTGSRDIHDQRKGQENHVSSFRTSSHSSSSLLLSLALLLSLLRHVVHLLACGCVCVSMCLMINLLFIFSRRIPLPITISDGRHSHTNRFCLNGFVVMSSDITTFYHVCFTCIRYVSSFSMG